MMTPHSSGINSLYIWGSNEFSCKNNKSIRACSHWCIINVDSSCNNVMLREV